MSNSIVTFKEDEAKIILATSICEDIGIDLPTYLRICINRLIQEKFSHKEKGIPFSMKQDGELSKGMKAMIEADKIAQEYGLQDMTLDEINAEIAEARKNY